MGAGKPGHGEHPFSHTADRGVEGTLHTSRETAACRHPASQFITKRADASALEGGTQGTTRRAHQSSQPPPDHVLAPLLA